MGDAPPIIYDNVAFVDNYWRSDDNPENFAFNGRSVDGAYNLRTQWLDAHSQGWGLLHLLPAGYYIGTIDTNATNGGEGPIYASDWYGNTPDKPARTQTGYIYDHNVGAPRPLSGVWSASGGSGARTAAGQQGAQWGNVTDLAVAGGNNSVASGQPLTLSYLNQDRDSGNTITFYLDQDRNPYNDNAARTLGTTTTSEGSESIASSQSTFSTRGIGQGNYWLAAKVTDEQGHTRYAYGIQQVTVTRPPPIDAHLSDGVLTVDGTEDADSIRLTLAASNEDRLVVYLNDQSTAFNVSEVDSIVINGGNGNDNLSVSEKYGPIFIPARINGGNGNDTLVGASGNDRLYGGNGKDRLYGGAGRDRLDGGGDTDRLYAGTGKDFFVKAKTKELMDFAKGDLLA